MKQFIYACESAYSNQSGICRYVNINHIVELNIVKTQYEINVEITLTNNQRMIVLHEDDIRLLVGDEEAHEIFRIMRMFREEKAKEVKKYA